MQIFQLHFHLPNIYEMKIEKEIKRNRSQDGVCFNAIINISKFKDYISHQFCIKCIWFFTEKIMVKMKERKKTSEKLHIRSKCISTFGGYSLKIHRQSIFLANEKCDTFHLVQCTNSLGFSFSNIKTTQQ